MTNDNTRDQDRAWELMKKIGFAMLVTHDGDKLRARPMSACLERESNTIYFLTDADATRTRKIAAIPASICRSPTPAARIRLGHRHRRRFQ